MIGEYQVPKGQTPAVDRLIDDASEIRSDMHHQSCEARNALHNALREIAKAWNGLVFLETSTADGDEAGEGGGDLYIVLRDLREAPAIRRAQRWDGTERRRQSVEMAA